MMKMRKGWFITDRTGFAWKWDCPKAAAEAKAMGLKVTPIRILSSGGRWNCTACDLNMKH
jgi:hypothetical protein